MLSLGAFTALDAPVIKYKRKNGRERAREFYEPKFATATKFHYATYGNEAQMQTRYVSICMIASAPGHDIKVKWPKEKRF